MHFLKNIRNNRITEPTSELLFYSEAKNISVKWGIVKGLSVKGQFVKLSKPTDEAVYEKRVERQKVSHCLKVFFLWSNCSCH